MKLEALSLKTINVEKLLFLANKSIGKEHYQSFLRRQNRKSVKQSEIITYRPKIFENSKLFI